jgi:dinuclear metal center YbgI/SA1388 family protein
VAARGVCHRCCAAGLDSVGSVSVQGVATVRDCLDVLDTRYPRGWAESWDAVGLTCGDPAARVSRTLFAVDPTLEVAQEAVATSVDLLITHHPLFLRGVHSVSAQTPGGRVVETLIRGGCALFTAHTNADVARPGVSDALAAALGLRDLQVLGEPPDQGLDKIVVFVPYAATEAVLEALAAVGAGHLGEYDRCGWWGTGTGTFRPGPQARPAIGTAGQIETLSENRLEMVAPRQARAAVITALRAAHPYEEPAFDILPMAVPADRGLGRIGMLPEPEPLSAFLDRVAAGLPATAGGVRSTGDPSRLVERIAVCGGSGGELAGRASAAGADAFLTADGRHHYVLDAVTATGLIMVDVAHWASEWPWLADAAGHLSAGLTDRGRTVTTAVSTLVTDPWRLHR